MEADAPAGARYTVITVRQTPEIKNADTHTCP